VKGYACTEADEGFHQDLSVAKMTYHSSPNVKRTLLCKCNHLNMPVADGIASKPYTLNMLNPLCTHRESWSLFSDLYVSICACLSRQSLSSALFSDLYCTLTADSDDFYHVSLCFCKRTMSVITLFLPSAQPSL
jgi:hypothetical protein